jgi:hypothetical protein
LEELGIDNVILVRIILKFMLKKGVLWAAWICIHLRVGTSDNEPFVSIKFGEFLD